jgi:hypothetical protein
MRKEGCEAMVTKQMRILGNRYSARKKVRKETLRKVGSGNEERDEWRKGGNDEAMKEIRNGWKKEAILWSREDVKRMGTVEMRKEKIRN